MYPPHIGGVSRRRADFEEHDLFVSLKKLEVKNSDNFSWMGCSKISVFESNVHELSSTEFVAK